MLRWLGGHGGAHKGCQRCKWENALGLPFVSIILQNTSPAVKVACKTIKNWSRHWWQYAGWSRYWHKMYNDGMNAGMKGKNSTLPLATIRFYKQHWLYPSLGLYSLKNVNITFCHCMVQKNLLAPSNMVLRVFGTFLANNGNRNRILVFFLTFSLHYVLRLLQQPHVGPIR